jgi:hypothetical protein
MATAKKHKGSGSSSGGGGNGSVSDMNNAHEMDDDDRSGQDSGSENEDDDTHAQLNLTDPLSRGEKRVKKDSTSPTANLLVTSGLNDFTSLAHHQLAGHLPLAFSQSSLLNNPSLAPSAHHHHHPHHSAHLQHHHSSSHSLLSANSVNNLSPLPASGATNGSSSPVAGQHPLAPSSHLHHPHAHLHHQHAHPQSNPLSHLHHALPLTAHPHPAFLAALHRH